MIQESLLIYVTTITAGGNSNRLVASNDKLQNWWSFAWILYIYIKLIYISIQSLCSWYRIQINLPMTNSYSEVKWVWWTSKEGWMQTCPTAQAWSKFCIVSHPYWQGVSESSSRVSVHSIVHYIVFCKVLMMAYDIWSRRFLTSSITCIEI